jgi:hypothetical protein
MGPRPSPDGTPTDRPPSQGDGQRDTAGLTKSRIALEQQSRIEREELVSDVLKLR